MKINGIAEVISSTALSENRLPDSFLHRAAIRNYYPARSGDLLVIFKPNYFFNGFGSGLLAENHGSPWRYDTYVPIIFAGSGLKKQHINRSVDPKDIASTLSAIVRAKPPSASTGTPLLEVLLGL